MSETFPAYDWARDETTRSLLEIFDRADTHARISQERHAEEVRRLSHVIAERDQEISRLHAEVLQLNRDVRQLGESMSRMQSTLSWRITKPIRSVRLALDRFGHRQGGV